MKVYESIPQRYQWIVESFAHDVIIVVRSDSRSTCEKVANVIERALHETNPKPKI